jgi:hypothetical protein
MRTAAHTYEENLILPMSDLWNIMSLQLTGAKILILNSKEVAVGCVYLRFLNTIQVSPYKMHDLQGTWPSFCVSRTAAVYETHNLLRTLLWHPAEIQNGSQVVLTCNKALGGDTRTKIVAEGARSALFPERSFGPKQQGLK